MFGYVRPALDGLSEEDRGCYRQAYCGLCHALGRRHGWMARFTLSYDLTFLALLYAGEAGAERCSRRCPAHPLRAPAQCFCGEALDRAADASVILTWYKLCDDVADHGPISGLPYHATRLLFRRAYCRAAEALPELDARAAENMARLAVLERERSPQLDRVADTFAGILAAAGKTGGDEKRHRVMEQLLYHLGRWVYLADAWDDLEKDRKKDRYNPLNARFAGHASEERDYVETTMTHSIRLAGAAAELLDLGPQRAAIENVLYTGLPTVQRAVLEGRWKEVQKQGRKIHERSV